MFWRQKIYFPKYELKAFEAAFKIELALHKINGKEIWLSRDYLHL